MPCSQFIDIKRLWQRSEAGTPVLNLAYLIDYVMRRVQPLDWDAVVASDIPLKVGARPGPLCKCNFTNLKSTAT